MAIRREITGAVYLMERVDRPSTELMGAADTGESGEGRPSSGPVVLDPAASTAAMGLEELDDSDTEDAADNIDSLLAELVWEHAEPPRIESLAGLKAMCVYETDAGREYWQIKADSNFWQTMAKYAALCIRGAFSSAYPVTTWESAIECLEAIEKQEPAIVGLINAEFELLFCGDDDMATATAKRPVKAKAATGTKQKAGKPAAITKPTKAKTAKVDESLFRREDVIQQWDVDAITKSPYDAREEESDKSPELLSLVASIKNRGVVNALLIRPSGEHIAGWRRRRAAKMAGLKTVPVILVHCDDLTAGDLVLEENEKRKPLTEREQCVAYNARLQQYIEAGKNQKQLAAALSLDHSTLSNKLRLKSLSHDSWTLFEEGWLTLDHIRGLATHAMVAGFEEAFLGYLDTQTKTDASKPLPEFAVKNAMTAGYQKAYRPVSQSQGCSFKVKDDQKKELGVTTIEHPQYGKIEVATNVEKWEELKAAAEVKQQQKAEKATTAEAKPTEAAPPKPMKEPAKVQKEKNEEKRAACLLATWLLAFASAIRSRFEKVKKQDIPQLIRLGIVVQQSTPEPEQMELDVLLGEETDFVSELRLSIVGFFAPATTQFANNYECLPREQLKQIAEWLGVLPGDFWRPDAELLKTCSDFELFALRDELEIGEALEDKNRPDLAERILKAWDEGGSGVGWHPDYFACAIDGKKK
jgi:ParB/RepB/Spo0J family partition protein